MLAFSKIRARAAERKGGEAVLAAGDWHSALSFASDGLPLKGTPFTIEGAPPAHTEIGSFGCETAAVLRDYLDPHGDRKE